MALNGKLIQRVTGVHDSSDIGHTSGYAAAQNGSGMGAASTETFSQRREIDKNRTVIKGYGQAKVSQRTNMYAKAQTYQESMAASETRMEARMAARSGQPSDGTSRQEFNARREAGGLQSFSNRQAGGTGAGGRQGYGGASQGGMAGVRQQQQSRQAMAARFGGGSGGSGGAGGRVSGASGAVARPVPKTGGFGRH